ncbi:MAG: hypothetical protein H0X33_07295 [Taibaiella sp.]|nr:hypothetical protein [Taibaiella sp.]
MNDGLHTGQKVEWAMLLYTRHDYTLPEIALQVDEPEETIQEWIQEGEWNSMKRSLLTSKETHLQILYDVLDDVVNRIKSGRSETTKDADLAIKYTAAIKNLETDTSVADMIYTGKKFTRWLQASDPMMAKNFSARFDKFMLQVLKK